MKTNFLCVPLETEHTYSEMTALYFSWHKGIPLSYVILNALKVWYNVDIWCHWAVTEPQHEIGYFCIFAWRHKFKIDMSVILLGLLRTHSAHAVWKTKKIFHTWTHTVHYWYKKTWNKSYSSNRWYREARARKGTSLFSQGESLEKIQSNAGYSSSIWLDFLLSKLSKEAKAFLAQYRHCSGLIDFF